MSINKGLKPNMTKDDPVIPLKKLQNFQEILSGTEKKNIFPTMSLCLHYVILRIYVQR